MKRIGLADGEPLFCSVGMSHYAYPVPLKETEIQFAQIKEQLEGEELYLHGRTGAHRYLNVDGVVKASMDLAERLNA
jgi:UDP-galactopyranose mutase